MCFRDNLPTLAPTEELITTEEPLEEYDAYDEQNTEPFAEPTQLEDAERFTEEHIEDHSEPPKTAGAESRSSWPHVALKLHISLAQ